MDVLRGVIQNSQSLVFTVEYFGSLSCFIIDYLHFEVFVDICHSTSEADMYPVTTVTSMHNYSANVYRFVAQYFLVSIMYNVHLSQKTLNVESTVKIKRFHGLFRVRFGRYPTGGLFSAIL